MIIHRNNFYFLLNIACLAGYAWLAYHIWDANSGNVGVCLIKEATNIPCPSCGSTRAIISLTQGRLIESILLNPLGLLISGIMLLGPLWSVADKVFKKESLFHFYQSIEITLKRKKFAALAITLVVANWVWNISKGL